MPHTQANGVDFYYELHGEGPPLVLISGYTCNHAAWQTTVELLKEHFQVLIFDNQGIGQTQDHHDPLTAQEMADNIMALIASIGFKQPYIAGSSMGGTITQRIASYHGDKVKKVALLATTAKWRKAMLMGLETPLAMRENDRDFEEIFQAVIPWVFGEDFLSDQKKVNLLKQLILEDPYPQSLENQKRQYNVLTTFDGRKDLTQIQVPTLILYAIEDVIALPYESEFLAKHISNSKLIECPGGHDIATENPKLVAQHLKKFFLD